MTALAERWMFWQANLPVAASLIVGSLPGVFVGGRLSASLHPRYLRPVVTGLLAIAGVRLFPG